MESNEGFKFEIEGIEKIACSKKCKKVAKFAYLLKKKSDETEILRSFEKMLKKKL